MWLSKDERRLLAGYYTLIGEIDKPRGYRQWDLTALLAGRANLASVSEYGKSASEPSGSASMEDMSELASKVKQTLDDRARVEKANNMLVARNMLTIQPHENEHGVIFISLTLDGYDLGRRYRNWWSWSGLLFEEYRNHWIWLILSFVGGTLGTKVLDCLIKLLLNRP